MTGSRVLWRSRTQPRRENKHEDSLELSFALFVVRRGQFGAVDGGAAPRPPRPPGTGPAGAAGTTLPLVLASASTSVSHAVMSGRSRLAISGRSFARSVRSPMSVRRL